MMIHSEQTESVNLAMDEPWNATKATYRLREMGAHPALSVAYKLHATERLAERSIIVSDVLYLIRNGFVYSDPIPAKTVGYYRYEIVCRTPNSGGRELCVVVIPSYNTMTMKIVTVMWRDEVQTRAGSTLEEQQ